MRARKLFVGFVALLAVLGTPAVAGAAEGGEFANIDAEHCAHILAEGGTVEECQEAPNPILPATNEIIWGGLAFIILFGLLAKLGLPAVQKSMEERTAKIQGDLDAADAAKAEQTAVLERYNAQLAEAKAEAARIVEEARQSADAVRKDLTQRAEAEAAELRQRNAEQLTAERERLMGEVQGQVATLAIELAERVVEGNLDRDAQLRLIDSYIANVGSR